MSYWVLQPITVMAVASQNLLLKIQPIKIRPTALTIIQQCRQYKTVTTPIGFLNNFSTLIGVSAAQPLPTSFDPQRGHTLAVDSIAGDNTGNSVKNAETNHQ